MKDVCLKEIMSLVKLCCCKKNRYLQSKHFTKTESKKNELIYRKRNENVQEPRKTYGEM